jgi:GntR family transcriptional regulator, arabinose operon transcriptional repressor
MASVETQSPRASQLADRLVADIKSRRLKAGDRYLTTAEAASLLSVGNGAANRALQVLERRRLIVRQQRRGAYVVDPLQQKEGLPLHRVHFLVHQKYLRTEGVGQDESLLGIERQLPGVPVQISFLPVSNEADFVEELLNESAKAKRQVGFVLVRASYETQRLLADRRVPAVVNGTVYPSIDGLACLTPDMKQAGAILARHLLGLGRKRIAYFNRQIAYGGDQLTIEGILSSLFEAGCGFDALTLRFLPTVSEVYAAEATRLLKLPKGPRGFVCRTVRMADDVVAAGKALGMSPGKDFEVAVCDYYLKANELPRFAWSRPQISSEELGARLAQLLISQVTKHDEPVGAHVVPVELEVPVNVG